VLQYQGDGSESRPAEQVSWWDRNSADRHGNVSSELKPKHRLKMDNDESSLIYW